MTLKDVLAWAQLVTAGIAVGGFALTAYFSRMSLRLTRESLEENRKQAWNYQGAAQCSAYRDQVLKLHELGLSPDEIKSWFASELSDPDGPDKNGYEALARGCGTAEALTANL